MIGCESLLERDAAHLFEGHPYVVAYYAQPAEEHYYDESGARHAYYPDFRIELSSGEWLYVEVKPASQAALPANRDRHELIARNFKRRDIGFRVFTEKEIRREPRWTSLRRIRAGSKLPLTRDRAQVLHGRHVANSKQTFGRLAEVAGEADTLRMLWSGNLVFDLREPLSIDTIIHFRNDTELPDDAFLL